MRSLLNFLDVRKSVGEIINDSGKEMFTANKMTVDGESTHKYCEFPDIPYKHMP